MSTVWPGMEACEVHSMSMEFMAWPWSELFFGQDTRKFHYSHLSSALTFIPYGTMVDHFQHIVYEHPELTPAQRHAEWEAAAGDLYALDEAGRGDPFYAEGEAGSASTTFIPAPSTISTTAWPRPSPLELWAMMQRDQKDAWGALYGLRPPGRQPAPSPSCSPHAGLKSPFDEACLREVCQTAQAWLDQFDLTGME